MHIINKQQKSPLKNKADHHLADKGKPFTTGKNHKFVDSIKELLKPFYHKIKRAVKWYRRIGLKCSDFSIISNNCTGGYVYQFFGIKYSTPTEGLFFSVDDYLKIIARPKYYFNAPLKFVEPQTTPFYKSKPFNYPVARIDDVIVYFMHYPTRREAETKWKRRSSRINWDKLFFLLTESDTMRDEHVGFFSKFIETDNLNGILLTTKTVSANNVKTIENVPTVDGVPQWRPEIIIKSLNWKKIINSL